VSRSNARDDVNNRSIAMPNARGTMGASRRFQWQVIPKLMDDSSNVMANLVPNRDFVGGEQECRCDCRSRFGSPNDRFDLVDRGNR